MLQQPLSVNGITLVENEPLSMMGIRYVNVKAESIEIEYDLLQATLEQLEIILVKIDVKLGKGWSERLRRALAHESEEWQIDSMEIAPYKHFHQ